MILNKENISLNSVYNPLDRQTRFERMTDLWKLIEAFFEKSALSLSDVVLDDALLLRIVIRIDQRTDYFAYFHSKVKDGKVKLDEMSQNKQIALLCFWIIKYKPIRIVDASKNLKYYADNKCTVNESFAAYIFISHIMKSDIPRSQKNYYNSDEYREDLRYKFMHHDISKEAMIFALSSIVCRK